MDNDQRWKLFNIDTLLAEIDGPQPDASTMDLYVAALSYKNFDFIERRLPFVVESVTHNLETWRKLVAAAPQKYWTQRNQEGVVIYPQTDHCGCLRSYRYRGRLPGVQALSSEWVTVADCRALYSILNTAAAKGVYDAWYEWMSVDTREATDLADGRFENTTVSRSLILSGMGQCLACKTPAVASARTTIASAPGKGTLIQLPLCARHIEEAKEQPSVLRFLGTLFSLSIDIPNFSRSESIPDQLISHLHAMVAEELGGTATSAENRERGWHLTVELSKGWYWLLRLNTLMDYSYMLFSPDEKKQVYRADSAPHHHDLPFFPDHEHSRPDRKKDVHSPSFLYGNPFFDFKRLRDVGDAHMNNRCE
ncbi:MAG: toxin-antitoxin system TumE family protein [Gammaproteobacteria bacterium]